jgi:glycerol kinase
VKGARERAERGELAFGTIDSWLVWKLTGGAVHATDPTNASRTLLYDIHDGTWDPELGSLFGVPASVLPTVMPSSGEFGRTTPDVLGVPVPIAGIAGDQQAALFGQGCVEPGMAKNTYGTGCFLLLNTGATPVMSDAGLVTTVACDATGGRAYALEGSVFIAGAAIQWLRDGVGLLKTAAESERIARSVDSTLGVYLVPAFVGLGAPYWDPDARGAFLGLTRGVTRAHLVRAALEALAYQTRDVVDAMAAAAGAPLKVLRVDGGASSNDFLMQLQADVLGVTVDRPKLIETTAAGSAFLAGLAVGFWRSQAELAGARTLGKRFTPKMAPAARDALYAGWRDAVARVRSRPAAAPSPG